MNLHVDIPTRTQIDRLLDMRQAASVSVYVATSPVSTGEAERIELKNLAREALRQLEAAEAPRSDVAAIDDAIAELSDDEAFWRYLARSLALFVTPGSVVTFRLPNQLVSQVHVSDRFHLKPLLRAVTFPQVAYVLALAQGSARVLEVLPDTAAEVEVSDLPRSAASAAGKASIGDRSPSRRVQGSEGEKLRVRQYARQVDQALRSLLGGSDVPLILAAAEPIDSIYRSVNTYPHLASTSIAGNPEATSDSELAARARTILDELYADELRQIRELHGRRSAEGRAASDIVDVARAATQGAVDTLLVDIDDVVPGTVDETGAVTLAATDDAEAYGVVDEVARRAWLTGARVLAVRREDVPGGGTVAAILRYAP